MQAMYENVVRCLIVLCQFEKRALTKRYEKPPDNVKRREWDRCIIKFDNF